MRGTTQRWWRHQRRRSFCRRWLPSSHGWWMDLLLLSADNPNPSPPVGAGLWFLLLTVSWTSAPTLLSALRPLRRVFSNERW